jgi:hypothetical protein
MYTHVHNIYIGGVGSAFVLMPRDSERIPILGTTCIRRVRSRMPRAASMSWLLGTQSFGISMQQIMINFDEI